VARVAIRRCQSPGPRTAAARGLQVHHHQLSDGQSSKLSIRSHHPRPQRQRWQLLPLPARPSAPRPSMAKSMPYYQ
jgi:hypothetical protein